MPAHSRVVPLTVAMFLLFIPLAFSEDFVHATYDLFGLPETRSPVTIVVDAVLLAMLVPLALWSGGVRWRLFALGAISMLFLDALVGRASRHSGR